MSEKLQVRVVSPWFGELETEHAVFSAHLPTESADALLCEWAPDDELFTFPRRKAWYCCEPACQFEGLGGGSWVGIRDRLDPSEFLWHNHPDPRYRVPHLTHFEPLAVDKRGQREGRAVAIVSNHGGSPWRRHPDITYRNRLVTHPLVDLFGRSGWARYRSGRFSRAAAPANYCGELPGDWPAAGKRELLARYRVSVCMENMLEPHYFTEKFVEAACAGCIPVYRAHSTVAQTMLRGAAWIDPMDFGDNPTAILEAALSSVREDFQQVNAEWLVHSKTLAATHSNAVFDRIGNILADTI